MKTAKLMSYVMLAALVGLLMGCEKSATDGKDPSLVTAPVEDDPATSPDETADGGTEAPAMTVYTLDPMDSSISFAGSKSVAGVNIGTHYGYWTEYEGTVTVPEDGNLENAKIDLLIDMTSTDSDDADLTANLVKAEGLFQVEEFPESTFKSTSIKKTDKGYDVSGNLTLRGVKKNITFPAKITLDENKLTAEADFSLDRQAFNVDFVNQAGDYVVDDNVGVTFSIVAKPS